METLLIIWQLNIILDVKNGAGLNIGGTDNVYLTNKHMTMIINWMLNSIIKKLLYQLDR